MTGKSLISEHLMTLRITSCAIPYKFANSPSPCKVYFLLFLVNSVFSSQTFVNSFVKGQDFFYTFHMVIIVLDSN